MDILSHIALVLVPGLGNASIRKLIGLYPDENLFALSKGELETVFGRHKSIAECIANRSTFARAEQELTFCEKSHIRPLFFTDAAYPARLNRQETEDCPVLIYCLGDCDLNPERSVAVVGSRRATAQGRDNTCRMVRELAPWAPHIVSGLAYGIDSAAHTTALDHGLPTVAVLGHGLDRIYPTANRPLAKRILDNGGALVTEYTSGTAINPRYFPARNRIIAALSDATLVVEASEKSGSLITAAIAGSYQREVFALPGRVTDPYSKGTNRLIARNRALLVQDVRDIAFQMGWPIEEAPRTDAAKEAEHSLTEAEQQVIALLQEHERMTLDELTSHTGHTLAEMVSILFKIEMLGLVHTLPGHSYQLIRR